VAQQTAPEQAPVHDTPAPVRHPPATDRHSWLIGDWLAAAFPQRTGLPEEVSYLALREQALRGMGDLDVGRIDNPSALERIGNPSHGYGGAETRERPRADVGRIGNPSYEDLDSPPTYHELLEHLLQNGAKL
jgi:hypothetical protein